MAWQVYFWVIAAMLLLPLPFKLFEYATGRDESPKSVKVEEMLNLGFMLVGLAGLYAYVYAADMLSPLFWKSWVVLSVVISLLGLLWSPKLRYAVDVIGKRRTRVAIGVGFVLMGPMLFGVWHAGA